MEVKIYQMCVNKSHEGNKHSRHCANNNILRITAIKTLLTVLILLMLHRAAVHEFAAPSQRDHINEADSKRS